jgi:hypothetical protein
MTPLDYLPILAAACAIPQFLPQLRKLHVSGGVAGVSWAWATLTSVNNAAWFAYFLVSGYLTALIPSSSATTVAATGKPRMNSDPKAAWTLLRLETRRVAW